MVKFNRKYSSIVIKIKNDNFAIVITIFALNNQAIITIMVDLAELAGGSGAIKKEPNKCSIPLIVIMSTCAGACALVLAVDYLCRWLKK